MDTLQKIEHSRFLINRFDHYNDSINNKGAFYLSINTFILGGICIGYSSYCKEIKACGELYPWLIFIATFLLILCLASILCTIVAITPYLKDNHVNDDQPSLIFFGGISRYQCSMFVDKFLAQTESSMVEDCARQNHSLAKGLTTKFKWLTIASRFLLGEYVFLTIVIFLIFKIL